MNHYLSIYYLPVAYSCYGDEMRITASARHLPDMYYISLIIHFPVALIKNCDQKQHMEERACFGLQFQRDKCVSWQGSVTAGSTHEGRSRKLRDGPGKWSRGRGLELSQLTPRDILPPARMHHLSKQCHRLESTLSNTGACGGHFSLKSRQFPLWGRQENKQKRRTEEEGHG